MKLLCAFAILLSTIHFSCTGPPNPKPGTSVNSQLEAVDPPPHPERKRRYVHSKEDSLERLSSRYEDMAYVLKDTRPVPGYRFVITGDFDGDGTNEKLTEHFFSGLTNKETNKFYENVADYGVLVDLTYANQPISFVVSDNRKVDTLHIWSGGQLLGLSYLKNEGDLNGDGTHEVSYVVNWADWSNMNTCHIKTFKDAKWQDLYSFGVMDWQLPDLPEALNDYGFFGLENKVIITRNDTLNNRLRKQLREFPGFVKRINENKTRILVYDNRDGDIDTLFVNLNETLTNK